MIDPAGQPAVGSSRLQEPGGAVIGTAVHVRMALSAERLRVLLRPHIIIWLTVAVSTIAWIWPIANTARGFTRYSSLNAFSLGAVAVWYSLASILAFTGYKVGLRLSPVRRLASAPNNRIYLRLTVLAAIGVAYAWGYILSQVDVASALSNSTANVLAQALPQGAGVQTLRYVSALSAALALHRWTRRRYRPSWDLVFNLLLLGATAILSSRLVLVLSVLTAIFLRSRDHDFHGVRVRALAIVGAALFFVTAALNYSRNANYYEYYGITNPVAMNLTEMAAYLGSPMQVAVGVSDALANGTISRSLARPQPALNILVPTYASTSETDLSVRPYTSFVDVGTNLTTNSVFADVLVDYGVGGLMVALVMIGVAAFLAGHLTRYENYVGAGAGVLLYAFAELWRVYLLNAGILHALLLALLVAAWPLRLLPGKAVAGAMPPGVPPFVT